MAINGDLISLLQVFGIVSILQSLQLSKFRLQQQQVSCRQSVETAIYRRCLIGGAGNFIRDLGEAIDRLQSCQLDSGLIHLLSSSKKADAILDM